MKPVSTLLSAAPILVGLLLTHVPLRADLTFYGVKFPSAGPKTSGVIRSSLPDFPWLSARRVRTPQDLERLTNPGAVRKGQDGSSVKPAIFYLSKQAAKTGTSNLAQNDAHFFLQEDVTSRVKEYRWYWTDLGSVASRLLMAKYGLKSVTTVLVFEADGSLLHAEAPIAGPQSVARAMRMIGYKRKMTEALKADLPELRVEFKEGNVKPLVKYLQHADKHIMYASQWTLEKLSAMKRAVNHRGEQQISAAEEFAANGDRKQALAILGEVKREYGSLSVAARAEKVARQVRRGKS